MLKYFPDVVKVSRLTERARESGRYVFLTKSCWLTALNSICPGCARQGTWGWVLGATGKCLAKIHLAALGWIFLHIVSLMLPKGPVLLLYEKKQVSNLTFCTKINLGFWPVTDTSNQASSAPPELSMHNRTLIWTCHNIAYLSISFKLLLISAISQITFSVHFPHSEPFLTYLWHQ